MQPSAPLAYLVYEAHGLRVFQLPVLNDNYIYLLRDDQLNRTAVVDPAEAEAVEAFLDAHDWELSTIFNTHHHADHIGGNRRLRERYGCAIYAAEHDRHRIITATHGVRDGELLPWGALELRVIATPGHTLGHIVYYAAAEGLLFCGDTLFALGCGRLFEGSAATMWESLSRLLPLPAATLVLCAHEYTLANARFTQHIGHEAEGFAAFLQGLKERRAKDLPTVPTTLGQERRFNPFLRAADPLWRQQLGRASEKGEAVFAELRRQKDSF